MPMMAITTSSSMRVNAFGLRFENKDGVGFKLLLTALELSVDLILKIVRLHNSGFDQDMRIDHW